MDNKNTYDTIPDTYNNIRQILKNNLYSLIVLGVSVAYIFYGLLKVDETGKTLVQIITDGCLSFLVGSAIGKLLSMQGYANGRMLPELITARKAHSDIVVEIHASVDRLNEFCKERNEEDVKYYRTCLLASEALKYEDFIKGEYKDYMVKGNTKYSKSQKKAIGLAYKPKFKYLTPNDLLSGETIKSKQQNDMGETTADNMKRSDIKAIGNKFIYAVIFGYFGINLAEGFDWGNLIWTSVQVCLFLSSGAMRYFNAYMFIKENLVDRYNKQIEYINMFIVWEKNNPRIKKELNQSVEEKNNANN